MVYYGRDGLDPVRDLDLLGDEKFNLRVGFGPRKARKGGKGRQYGASFTSVAAGTRVEVLQAPYEWRAHASPSLGWLAPGLSLARR